MIKGFLKSNTFKRFLWLTADAFIGAWIVFLTDISWVYAPLIIAVLQTITKELNKKWAERKEVE
jgi:hypothetical protein